MDHRCNNRRTIHVGIVVLFYTDKTSIKRYSLCITIFGLSVIFISLSSCTVPYIKLFSTFSVCGDSKHQA
jgi:hypothetical protein